MQRSLRLMRPLSVVGLTLMITAVAACATTQRGSSVALPAASPTSVLGHWVLATPIDSTSFVGASQVELVLAQGSFEITATYPARAPLTVSGSAELGAAGSLVLVPATTGADASAVGLPPGQPYTRVASAAGSTLVLAPPTSRVPVPSSVWYRIDAARAAGLAR